MKLLARLLALAALLPAAAFAQPIGLINGQTPAIGFSTGDCVTISAGGMTTGSTCASGSPTTSQTITGATGTSPSWQAKITGDTDPRFVGGLNSADGGRIATGPGNAALDTFLGRSAAASWRLGQPDAAAPVSQTLGVQGVVAGTTDTSGVAFFIRGAASTGTGTGGAIQFQNTPAGSTGSSQNAFVTNFRVTPSIAATGTNIALGVGTTTLGGYALRVSANVTGNVTGRAQRIDSTFQSDVTTAAYVYEAAAGTQATSFTLASLRHFYANPQNFGAGSTVTAQYGFYTENLTGAGTNYGFFSGMSGTSGRFAFYGNGNSPSVLGGNLQIGTTTQFTMATTEFGMATTTASATAPGAGGGKLGFRCGTNAGTAKLVAYAGTSSTAVTVIDNIGTGVTGC